MERVDNYRMGKHATCRYMNIFMKVSSGDVDFLVMIKGLVRGMFIKDKMVYKELIDEFCIIWVGEFKKWKKSGKDEKVRDRVRETFLIKWMGFSEVVGVEQLVCCSLHFEMKEVILLCRTTTMILSHRKVKKVRV